MSDIIEFLLSPYQSASFQDIALEITAVLFGIASVYFGKAREKIAVYPTGIVSTVIYVYVCWTFELYGDFLDQYILHRNEYLWLDIMVKNKWRSNRAPNHLL